MEPSTIFFLACVFVLLFLVYYSYSFNSSVLLSSPTIANAETIVTIPPPATGSLKASFTFAIWININDWTTGNGSVKNIISYGKSAYISLDQTTNQVWVAVKTGRTYTIKNTIYNIPLQTWTHLAFCLNGLTLDSYLNGKLVNTSLLPAPYSPANADDTVILGGGSTYSTCVYTGSNTVANTAGGGDSGCYYALNNSNKNPGFNGWLTQFNYFPDAQDPQTIWNLYYQGNGTGGLFGNLFSGYGLTLALTSNGKMTNSISI